jgi:hypothetical protein
MTMLTVVIPYLPFNTYLGFQPLPVPLLFLVLGITVLYVLTAEVTKRIFYARFTSESQVGQKINPVPMTADQAPAQSAEGIHRDALASGNSLC